MIHSGLCDSEFTLESAQKMCVKFWSQDIDGKLKYKAVPLSAFGDLT